MILCFCNVRGAKVPVIFQIRNVRAHTSSFFGSGFFASGFFLGVVFFGGGFLSASSSVEETTFFLGGFFFTSSSEEELSEEDELEDDSELSDNCKKVRARMLCAKVLRGIQMMCWKTSHNENGSFLLKRTISEQNCLPLSFHLSSLLLPSFYPYHFPLHCQTLLNPFFSCPVVIRITN